MIQADDYLIDNDEDPKCLDEAARNINKGFSTCITDRFYLFIVLRLYFYFSKFIKLIEQINFRSPLNTSRKWGVYYMAGFAFKTYFKVKKS